MLPSNQISCVHLKINFILSLVLLVIRCDAMPVDGKSESINHPFVSSSSRNSLFSLISSSNDRPTRIHIQRINQMNEKDNNSHENSHSVSSDTLSDRKEESHQSKLQTTDLIGTPNIILPVTSTCACLNPNELPHLLARAPHVLSNALKIYSQVHGRDKFDQLIRSTIIVNTIHHNNKNDDEEIDEELDKDIASTSEELELDPLHSNSESSFESISNKQHSPSAIALTRDDLQLIDIPVNLKSQSSDLNKSPLTSSSSASSSHSHMNAMEPASEDVKVLDHPIKSSLPHRNFLVIPRMRMMPFGSRVKVMARNKVLEIKIPVTPYMSVYDALKQAENRFHINSKQMNTKWIEVAPLTDENSSSICFTVHRIGKIADDSNHHWNIRVSSANGQVVYDGQCIPDEDGVIIRPNSIVELIFTQNKLDR